MGWNRWIIVGLAIGCFCLRPGPCVAYEPGDIVNIQFENDFFGGGTDQHFTHGTRIEFVTRPMKWITDLADKLPWFSYEKAEKNPKDALKGRASISLGQNMYTPEDTTSKEWIPDDRPYAGWLYVGFGLAANQGPKRYDKVELELGMVGPASQAEQVQTFWHSSLGLHVPEGWDNQLHNEPGVVLYYEQAWRLGKWDLSPGLKVDAVPHYGGALGNVYTYGAGGFTARLGSHLEDDFGPPRIRPSMPGSGHFRPGSGLRWYLFAGVEVRAVLQNIFLDGNTFTDSPSVDKKPLVGDFQTGLALQWNRFRFSYTQIFRTREFYGQDSADIFGAVSLSCFF